MKNSILIVDDDKNTREAVVNALSHDYITYTASNGQKAMDILNEHGDIDLVLTDLMMPEMDGIELLEKIHSINNDVTIVMITGYSTIESAVDAMRKGVYDYITKPVDLNKLEITIKNALEVRRLKSENILLKQKFKERFYDTTLVGKTKKIREIMELVNRISSTKATVLIQGESGTGKELVANMIHYSSPVAEGPFIKVSCSALSEGVIESELFGHEKGAFTGAFFTKKGRFELADGGTLFLDEIGDVPKFIQVKLLRFLQGGEFERVGGTKTIKVDVRIISAANKNLDGLVTEEKIREDLYYRLKVVTIEMPALRERKEDIPFIVDYHLKRFSEIHNKRIRDISPEAMRIIDSYDWPGNIRELMNCIESAVVMTHNDHIDVEDLPPFLSLRQDKQKTDKSPKSFSEIEKKAIFDALNRAEGNKVQAAKILGIGLRTLYRKLEQYGVKG